MRTVTTTLFVLSLLVFASCTGNTTPKADETLTIKQTSERLIKNDVAAIVAKGDLEPQCPEIPNPAIGQVFRCSAFTEDKREVLVEGVVQNSGRILLKTVNVIMAEDLSKFEIAAVDRLNEKGGFSYDYSTVRCEDENIILVTNQLGKQVIACSFVDPSNASVFNAEISVTDVSKPSVEVNIFPRQ